MEINWFTVIAQIINFFILVWLLKKFLYKPILKAIDERESKIAAQLKEAEVRKAEAKKEQQEFQQKNVRFDLEKKDRADKMVLETNEERQKLLDQARKDAEALAKHLEKSAEEKQLNQYKELNQKIKKEVFAVSRKTLEELASVGLEEQLTKVFIKRLNTLKEKELKQLKAAFKETSDAILVRSALVLPKKQQNELKKTIDTILEADTPLRFEETPALIGGIELSTNEYKLAWSISEYLRAFENEVSK
ncbi:MAG: F0F1 ATP synthase subunit B [Cyclobacterium sp.]|uniref:F0F1 ATP synthase subunit B family protein n=1 Tax=unclassified Cyclobacterium TaxID=2615055 RepID=UPI0013D55067|nr:F0F1 ATP synthase subunit B [Cyclobacterium sp. SYSU L10401]